MKNKKRRLDLGSLYRGSFITNVPSYPFFTRNRNKKLKKVYIIRMLLNSTYAFYSSKNTPLLLKRAIAFEIRIWP